jgi:hypothetical protein
MDRNEFLFTMGTIPTEMTETDEMLAQNIHRFAQSASFIEASMVGGKITPSEAMARVKDLYKTLKTNNKNLKKKS